MSSPRLHPETIEQVRQAADIVDVVAEHVVLRKQGRGFVGSCPFHDDKSPSFSVSPEKQFYYCFGCGAGGNVYKFLMELRKQSFSEVVLDLAQRYQVPVQTLAQEERQELQRQISLKEQLYEVMAIAAQFYEHSLHQPSGQHALAYVVQKRGLTEDTLQHFQLGYAPGGWETLYRFLVDGKGLAAELVEKAGLIVPRQNQQGHYDRFRDRLMIPIHDQQSRIVGFGSRTLTNEEPKYLNSPETDLFNKGQILFGLDKARKAIVKQDKAIVVEGYFDVIALHGAGIANAVASMGTALTSAQIRQLLRYTESKQIILNFDADKAGQKAAERAISEVEDLALRGEVQLRVLNLPNGKDADEFLKERSNTAYQQLVEAAPLWLDWQIQAALAGKDLRESDRFQAATQTVVQLLGKLPNATLRTHYIHRCAEWLSQGDARQTLQIEDALRQQVRGQRWHGRSQKWQRPADYSLREAAEAQLLRIYLHCPYHRQDVKEALRQRDLEFTFSHHRFLWRQVLGIEERPAEAIEKLAHPELDASPADIDLMDALQDLCTQHAQEMQQVYHLMQLNEATEIEILRPTLSIRTAVATLERIACEKRCRHVLELLQAALKEASREYEERPMLDAYLAQVLDEASDEADALMAEENRCFQELDELKRLYYQEKRYLQQIENQRCISISELGNSSSGAYLPLN
ncbi:DNA primase [Altericista sp. CCNU0014]|uniref:DNA primase n=1 Tax=Altericista sp. CCNU0014 TaxID=3082949 RepID=UPI0038500D50